jgi:hypothetical protein
MAEHQGAHGKVTESRGRREEGRRMHNLWMSKVCNYAHVIETHPKRQELDRIQLCRSDSESDTDSL